MSKMTQFCKLNPTLLQMDYFINFYIFRLLHSALLAAFPQFPDSSFKFVYIQVTICALDAILLKNNISLTTRVLCRIVSLNKNSCAFDQLCYMFFVPQTGTNLFIVSILLPLSWKNIAYGLFRFASFSNMTLSFFHVFSW